MKQNTILHVAVYLSQLGSYKDYVQQQKNTKHCM